MNSSSTKSNESNKDSVKSFHNLTNCKVSKASTEIMLDRFHNGHAIEFPFSQ